MKDGDIMLNDKIATLRKAKNLSQEELAEILNTSRQAVSKWERGETYPDIDKLKDLAIFFNVSIDYLLDYDIDALSVKNFIARIEKCFKERTYDIDIDEIKLIVSKNNNNFALITKVCEYLYRVLVHRVDSDVSDLLIGYCKRAILIRPDNSDVSANDIHQVIIHAYEITKRLKEAKDYLKENNVYDAEDLLAEIEFELGNYSEANDIASVLYFKSFSYFINGNTVRLQLLLKENKIEEAYELCEFVLKYISMVIKNEELSSVLSIMFNFAEVTCMRYLKKDYQDKLEYLKANCPSIIDYSGDSSDINYYYSKRVDLHSFFNVKDELYFIITDILKDSVINKDALYIYNEVFGGSGNE